MNTGFIVTDSDVGGLEYEFYFSHSVGNNYPNWLSYFSEGLKPPTIDGFLLEILLELRGIGIWWNFMKFDVAQCFWKALFFAKKTAVNGGSDKRSVWGTHIPKKYSLWTVGSRSGLRIELPNHLIVMGLGVDGIWCGTQVKFNGVLIWL